MSVIFSANHDSSTTITDFYSSSSGDNITIDPAAAYTGTTNGLQIVLDDTTADYAQKVTIGSTTGVVRARFYINKNTLTSTYGDTTGVFYLYNNNWDGVVAVVFSLSPIGEVNLHTYYGNDAGLQPGQTWFLTAGWHCIELYCKKSSGANDGVFASWDNGSLVDNVSGIDNDTKFAAINNLRFGCTSACLATTTGTYYLDELEINDDGGLIGPLGGPSASVSPSVSPSLSPSASFSQSPSTSPTPSASASISPSGSLSPSASASPSTSSSPSPSMPPGAIIGISHDYSVNITDPSNYTATGGADISITTAAALAGTINGLDLNWDDTTGDYAEKSFSSTTGKFRMRFYFDPNSVALGQADHTSLVVVYRTGYNSFVECYFDYVTTPAYRVKYYISRDSTTLAGTQVTISDAPHYFEFFVQRASGDGVSDGIFQSWIDGARIDDLHDINNYNKFSDAKYLRVGNVGTSVLTGAGGHYYIDEIVANETGEEIGPLGGGPSESVSPSLSQSASLSQSPSVSPSISQSASVSPSISASASASPSVSGSASVSLSISQSASVSPSVSGSASVSPSVSQSVSPSISASISPSVSPSVSPSISGSASESPSISQSASVSPSLSESSSESPSPSTPLLVPPICWGHFDFITEQWEAFTGNWTGTGAVWVNNGFMNTERLELEAGEYMTSRVVETGTLTMEIDYNHYSVGDTVLLEYRHGNSEANCLAAAWNTYTVPFMSLGYVQIRVTSTL